MGNSLIKVSGIQLPGQSGKTKKMEEKLSEYMAQTRNEGCEDDLNIMFTSNNRLLVHQTSKRFDDDLGPETNDSVSQISTDSNTTNDEEEIAILKNGCATWTSSENQTTKDLAYDIITDEISMIVCCSHPRRWMKMAGEFGLLSLLEKNKLFKKNINLWIDEAHKSIKIWKKYIHVIDFQKIKRVTLVSASWDSIDKDFTIPRQTYAVTHPDVYRSLHECKWIIVDPLLKSSEERGDDNTAPSYLAQVLSISEIQSLITPNSLWLTPGNSKISTHDAVQDDLVNRNWNGLKLNGIEKNFIFYVDKQSINYTDFNSENQEVKDVLVKAFDKFPSLNNSPFFVTGLNCIKEGITFQSNGLHFKGAILPPIADASDAYQLACRVAGNIKGHDVYDSDNPCVIITTSKMEKKIKKQENINIFLPRILYEEGRSIPTDFDKRRAARGKCKHDTKGLGFRIFKEYSTFKDFLTELGLKSGFDGKPNGTDEYKNLYVCSVQSSRGATQRPRYVTEVIDKIDLAYGGKGARTGFPAYTDIYETKDTISPRKKDLVWIAVIPNNVNKTKLIEADKKYCDCSSEILKISKHYDDVMDI
jgi:hypothetical protein